MARITYDGYTRIGWASAIANIAAPTVAELNAAISLSAFLMRDGMEFPVEQNMVDSSDITSTQNLEEPGTEKFGPIKFKMFRDTVSGSDTPWNTFIRNATGFIVRRELIAVGTAWTAGQRVSVYPGKSHASAPTGFSTDTMTTTDVTIAVYSAAELRAVVAA